MKHKSLLAIAFSFPPPSLTWNHKTAAFLVLKKKPHVCKETTLHTQEGFNREDCNPLSSGGQTGTGATFFLWKWVKDRKKKEKKYDNLVTKSKT